MKQKNLTKKYNIKFNFKIYNEQDKTSKNLNQIESAQISESLIKLNEVKAELNTFTRKNNKLEDKEYQIQ